MLKLLKFKEMKYLKLPYKSILNEDYFSTYNDDSLPDDENELSQETLNSLKDTWTSVLKDKTLYVDILIRFMNFLSLFKRANFVGEVSQYSSSCKAYEYIIEYWFNYLRISFGLADLIPKSFYKENAEMFSELTGIPRNAPSNALIRSKEFISSLEAIENFYKKHVDIVKFFIYLNKGYIGIVKRYGFSINHDKDDILLYDNYYIHNRAQMLRRDSDIYKNILNGFKANNKDIENENNNNNNLIILPFFCNVVFDFSECSEEVKDVELYYSITNKTTGCDEFPLSKAENGEIQLNFVFSSYFFKKQSNDIFDYPDKTIQCFNDTVNEFKNNDALKLEFKKIENAINEELSDISLNTGTVKINVYLLVGPIDGIAQSRFESCFHKKCFLEKIF